MLAALAMASGEDGAGATADIEGTLLHDPHVVDGGQQQIKVNPRCG